MLQDPGGGIAVLLGPRGVGKTALAAYVATRIVHNAAVERAKRQQDRSLSWHERERPSRDARYAVLGDVLADARRAFNTTRGEGERDPLGELRRPAILVLDECQERASTDWEATELTRLLDYRYRECLSTLLIANLTPEAMAKALPASVVSRVQETGVVLTCEWPSFRTGGAAS